ncbi:MAG: T9SS C-terminal target domain-containing protein, partial [Candidatus Zixiibacteriota bacterium]
FPNTGSATNPQFGNPIYGWQNIPAAGGYATCWYDIDQDGDLDLFWASMNGYQPLWFYRNIGTPTNAQLVLESQNFLPTDMVVAYGSIDIVDIDNDGDGDFLLSSSSDGGMMFFRNTTGDTVSVSPYTKPRPQRVMDLSLSPQPGNPTTAISFHLPYAQEVDLAVYNLLGARVATLVAGMQMAGDHTFTWDASGYASGVYLVRLEAGGEAAVEKAVILK